MSASCHDWQTKNLQRTDDPETRLSGQGVRVVSMQRPTNIHLPELARTARSILLVLGMLFTARYGVAQQVPLISGGAGLVSTTNGGSRSYLPIIQPLLAAPIGSHFLFETRGNLVESITPDGHGGLNHARSFGLTYLQGDILASPHVTIVGGSFLIPFGTFNERLSTIWVNNIQGSPLISSLGTMSTGTGVGGMLRGSAVSTRKFSLDYAGYFSAHSANKKFNSMHSAGGRVSMYLPESRLEIGFSYNRSLEGIPAAHENFRGAHVWWEPKDTAFRLRSEFARGHHAQGYWIQADYRTQAFGGLDSWVGRIEPVFRMQQTFRRDTDHSDGLPLVNTQRADFGLDYNLPHETRILAGYSRRFAPNNGNENIWGAEITYRFLFPVWKGK